MFIINNYRISFQKKHAIIPSTRKGRHFDTLCRIKDLENEKIVYEGTAYLHPNDIYDKVIGKKIALSKALFITNKNKQERTMIWKAFWKWVESWKQKRNEEKDKAKEVPLNEPSASN